MTCFGVVLAMALLVLAANDCKGIHDVVNSVAWHREAALELL